MKIINITFISLILVLIGCKKNQPVKHDDNIIEDTSNHKEESIIPKNEIFRNYFHDSFS